MPVTINNEILAAGPGASVPDELPIKTDKRPTQARMTMIRGRNNLFKMVLGDGASIWDVSGGPWYVQPCRGSL
ncbi:MAG: hypothetical protein P4L38_01665 [Syntrophaceae bacterium]|nr:hypothetical protein [Syntrophaceae bacterium]